MIEKLYTVEEVAELASVTGRTIRNYLKSGRLVGRKIGGQWRFPESEVQRLLTGADEFSALDNDELPAESDARDFSVVPSTPLAASPIIPEENTPMVETELPTIHAPVFKQPYVAPAPLPQPVSVVVPPADPVPSPPANIVAQAPYYSAPPIESKPVQPEAASFDYHKNIEVPPAAAAHPPIPKPQQNSDVSSLSFGGMPPATPAAPQQEIQNATVPPTTAIPAEPVTAAVAPQAPPLPAAPSYSPQPPFPNYGSYGATVPSAGYPLPTAPLAYPAYPNAPAYYPFLYGQVIPPFPGPYPTPDSAHHDSQHDAPSPAESESKVLDTQNTENDTNLSNIPIPKQQNTSPKRCQQEDDEFRNLSDVGQRVSKFVSEVHDCSYGPLACMVLDRYQTLEAAKHTSDKLNDLAFQESDEDCGCQSFVEYDERFSVARYTLFGSSHFMYQSLQIIG